MLKKENGVTLVALVITIIVLLILAGVTLIGVLGPNGIFTKARNAKLATEIANAKDAVSKALTECQSEQYDEYGNIRSATLADGSKANPDYVDLSDETEVISSINAQLKADGEKYYIDTPSSNVAVIKKGYYYDDTAANLAKATTIVDANDGNLSVQVWDDTNSKITLEFSNDAIEPDSGS